MTHSVWSTSYSSTSYGEIFCLLKAAMTGQLDPLFRTGLHHLEKAEWINEWINGFVKAHSKTLTKSNILGGWRGTGRFPRDVESSINSLNPMSHEPSSQPLHRIHHPPFQSDLNSPYFYQVLHLIPNRFIEIMPFSKKSFPIVRWIPQLENTFPINRLWRHYQAANTILRRENKELWDLISVRKKRQSGKIVNTKGKIHCFHGGNVSKFVDSSNSHRN